MPEIIELPQIAGVKIARLTAFGDARGRFVESFRKEWFPERSFDRVQTNCSHSRAGVLRGLHFHHHQVDVWFVPKGRVRAGLADLRRSSPTRGLVATVDLSDDEPQSLFIPVGVAHGFHTLEDAVLTYVVDNYHDGSDEHGVRWNDPDLAVPWGLAETASHGDPVISGRDQALPWLRELAEEQLPE